MKKTLLLSLSIIFVFMLLSISVTAVPEAQGICGDSIEWSYENGTLNITGTGDMYDLSYDDLPSWNAYTEDIKIVNVSEGITSLGDLSFAYHSSLEKISLPSTLTSVGKSCFEFCPKLVDITLPEGLTYIGEMAFSDCYALKQLTVPGTVKELISGTFIACQNLEELYISNGTESIAANVFYDCFKLKITLPQSVSYIAPSAFDPAPKLVRCVYGSYAETYARSKNWNIEYSADFTASGTHGDNITWEYDNGTLTLSGSGEMENTYTFTYKDLKDVVTRVVIDDGITSVADSAFRGYEKLEEAIIGKSVYVIGGYAFSGCRTLKKLTFLSDSVKTIGDAAFQECVDLTEIYLPYGVEYIGQSAFDFCCDLTELDIPDTVRHIGDYAFTSCTKLTRVTLPQRVDFVGKAIFSNCHSLKEVVLSEGITHITRFDFTNCISLEYITIPDSVTYIEEYTFYDTPDLTVICSKGSYAEKYALSNGLLLEGEYTDVSITAWYYESIRNVSLKGYMSGMGEKKFSPNSNLTRAQFVQLLFAMEGLDKADYEGETCFGDVPEGKWFSPAVKWAKDTEITSGTGDGKFDFNGMVTREQLARFMMKYAEYKDHDTSGKADISVYSDVSAVSAWAYDAVEWAVYEGIFTSTSDTSLVLAPRNFSTRAVAARVVSVFDTVINN